MEKKFQVFVSSTYTDLIDERQDTLKSILDLGQIPSGMEGFFAADEDQLKYIKRIIDECDYYILIIAGRYGSVDAETGISYTEQEYDYAVGKGITVLAFVHADISTLPTSKIDTDPTRIENLNQFKEKVCQRRLVSFWKDRDQLKSAIIISLSKAMRETVATGWVRGDAVASEDILAQLNDFRNEVDKLRNENQSLRKQLQPNVEGLAPLDSIYPIKYHYRTDRWNRAGTLSASWSEIFKVIGPHFFSPSGKGTMEGAIKSYICEKEGVRWLLDLRTSGTQLETIKLQMVAYGLMSVYAAEMTNGGMAEFIQLTDLGKRVLIELTAVKSS